MGLRERARADVKRREAEKTERQKKRGRERKKRLNELRRETAEWISELLDVDLAASALGAPDDAGGSGVKRVDWRFALDGFPLLARWESGKFSLALVGGGEDGEPESRKPIRRPADLLNEV